MKPWKGLLITQSVYYMVTALWALVHIKSFMLVTGPKTDVWLVKTVSVLLIPLSLVLFMGIFKWANGKILFLLGAGTAMGLATIDFYYTHHDVIPHAYKVDGYMQIIFLVIWTYSFMRPKEKEKQSQSTHPNKTTREGVGTQ